MQGLLKNSFIQNSSISTFKKSTQFLALVLFSASLLACGGGGGGPLPDSPEPVGEVNGVAFIGIVESGDVNVYEFTGGEQGASLGSGTIVADGTGAYSISLKTPSKPVMVCLSSVKNPVLYQEITNKNTVVFKPGQELCAVDNYVSGSKLTASLTYYSHISTALAKRLVSLGIDPDDAISSANQEMFNWVKYDINKTVPLDLNSISSAPTTIIATHRAGFANAAISVYSGWVNGISGIPPVVNGKTNPERFKNFNSILFAQRAYQDILFDGVLDGNMKAGKSGLGAVPMTTKIYRRDVALDMLVMLNSINKQPGKSFTNATKATLFSNASDYSRFDIGAGGVTSTYNIFGNKAAVASLQDVKPTMNNFIIPKVVVNDPAINGVKFAASVTDVVNQLTSIDFHIINKTTGIDTIFDTKLNVDNSGNPVDLSRSIGTLINKNNGTAAAPNFDYPDGANYGITIAANYTEITTGVNKTVYFPPQPTPVPTPLKSKPMTIGNIGTQINDLSLTPKNNSYVTGTFNMHVGISNPLGITSVNLDVDGSASSTPVSNFTSGKKYNVPIFRFDTGLLPDGSHNFLITAVGIPDAGKAGAAQSATVTASYIVDNTSPTINVIAPITPTSGWFTTDFNINVATSDAGSGMNNFKILVDGIVRDTLFAPAPKPNPAFSADSLILINSLADGSHTIHVQATDDVGLTSLATNPISIKTDNTDPTLVAISQSVTYTLPTTTCSINLTAADSASGVAFINIDTVPATVTTNFAALAGANTVNLQSFIPSVIPAAGATVNILLSVSDVAGLKSISKTGTIVITPEKSLTAPFTPIPNKYTCAVSFI